MNNHVLVVDDDPSIVRLVQHSLEKEGYAVDSASNGLQALKKANNGDYSLIILDLMLPGIDGFEVCQRLKTNTQTSQVPVLMLSGKTKDADKSEASKVGADVYLTKPIRPADLVSQVNSMLAEKAGVEQGR